MKSVYEKRWSIEMEGGVRVYELKITKRKKKKSECGKQKNCNRKREKAVVSKSASKVSGLSRAPLL